MKSEFVQNDLSSASPPTDSTLSRRSLAFSAPAKADGPGAQPDGIERILIVEDDLLIATEMEAALVAAGLRVVGLAASGEEALELAEDEPPTLAVVDIRLAGKRDGVDTALDLFRSHGIRCIFASAHSDHEARKRAEPAAPLGWLQKPYTMASLTATVRRALDSLHGKQS